MSNNKVNWKQKYYELRSKYMNAIDTAFRLGVEEGMKNAELENMQMQMQQMEQQQMAEDPMMGEEMSPEMGEEVPMEEGMEGEMPMEEEVATNDELGSSIDELESYVKNEDMDFAALLKGFHKLGKSEEVKKDISKSKKVDKINSILKKWDDEEDGGSSSTETENGEIIGQA